MKTEKTEQNISIYLTAEEVYRLQEGFVVGERLGATYPDAKVEVLPLSAVGEDDSLKDKYADNRLQKGLAAQLKGTLYANGDLQLIVPAIKLTDVRINTAHLRREAILTPLAGNGQELIQHVIPEGGVVIHFGGSLEIVDVNSYYPVAAE